MTVPVSIVQQPASAAYADDNRAAAAGFEGERGLGARLRDRRFWAVQVVVLLVTAAHWGLKLTFDPGGRGLGELYVVLLYALYLLPVLYASLNFGREGAFPTAVWSAMLAISSILLEHRGGDAVVEAVQLFTTIALGVVIADRVDREVAARRVAESEGRARRISDAKYRRLFDSASDAIVVFDASGVIQEANLPALELFGRPLAALRGTDIAAVIGRQGDRVRGRMLEADAPTSGQLRLARLGGPVRVEYVCAPLWDAGPGQLVQVIFRDVTERHEQRLAWCLREILRALEDERRVTCDIRRDVAWSLLLLRRSLDVLPASASAADSPLTQEEDLDLAAALGRASRGRNDSASVRGRPGAGEGGIAADPYAALTRREREVLGLIADGLANAEIAERLSLSPNTVHRHRTSLMRKLGVHDRFGLLRYCIRRGLVDPLTSDRRAGATAENV